MKKKTKRRFLIISILLVIGFAILNVLAFNHAHSMIYFTSGGQRTSQPEALTSMDKLKLLFLGVNVPRPASTRTPFELDPVCTNQSIESTDGSLLATWYLDNGSETPLVILFHGYAAEKSCLLREAKLFTGLGASVMLVDFRGSGESSESYTTVGYHEGDDVGAVMRYAQTHLNHSSIILFGQSMGAVAILRAVHEHGIVPDAIILEAVFDSLLNTVRNRFRTMGIPSFPCAELLVFWGGWQAGFNGFSHEPVEYAKSLTCPALFLHGADDSRSTEEEGRRVFANHTGSKEFIVFPSTEHGACAATHPKKWKTAVIQFLNKASSTRWD